MSYSAFTPSPSVTPSGTPPVVPFVSGQVVANDAALKAIKTLVAANTDYAPVGSQVRVVHALGGFTVWQLQTGVHADSPSTGFSEPTDYNAGSNQKYWQQINFPN